MIQLFYESNTLQPPVMLPSDVTPSLIPKKGTDFVSLNLSPCCHMSLQYIIGIDIEIIH